MIKTILALLIGTLITTGCEFEAQRARNEERREDACFDPRLSIGQSDQSDQVLLQFQTGGLPAFIETMVDAPTVDAAWEQVAEVSGRDTYALDLDFETLPEDAIVYARVSVECGDRALQSDKVEIFKP